MSKAKLKEEAAQDDLDQTNMKPRNPTAKPKDRVESSVRGSGLSLPITGHNRIMLADEASTAFSI